MMGPTIRKLEWDLWVKSTQEFFEMFLCFCVFKIVLNEQEK